MTVTTGGYRPRLADAYLEELMRDFPAVLINGPRATGKTTTARQVVADVVRLDQPGTAAVVRADPDAALRRVRRPALLDEWQEVPEILAAVKRTVDEDATPGQFVLTGSVRAQLEHEMWAGTGRAVRLQMFGLTQRELQGRLGIGQPSFLERLAAADIEQLTLPVEVPDLDGYVRLAVQGGFPEVVYRERSDRSRDIWMSSYLDQLLTRDAAALGQRKDPDRLRRYFEALSLNIAGLPTDATLYQAAGIDARTAASYERLLTDLHVLENVPAWSTNRLKRLVTAAKRYVVDPGLAAVAAGISASNLLSEPDLLGRFFDAFGTAQLRPEIALMHPRPRLHHLRTEGGRHEIDLVLELGAGRVVGIEFKAAAAPDRGDARHLRWLRDQLGDSFVGGAVLHSGPGIYELDDRILALPLCSVWA